MSQADKDYARTFAAVGNAIDQCGSQSERVTLLLSTCRNEFMTTNAIFVDLKAALGTDTRNSAFEQVIVTLAARGRTVDRHLDRLGLALSQVPIKEEVWQRRYELSSIYEEAAESLRGLARADALSVLSPATHDQNERTPVWDRKYTNVSQDQTYCTEDLEVLHETSIRCWAAFRLLTAIASLSLQPTRDTRLDDGLFAAEPPPTRWTETLAVLEQHTDVWKTERDGDHLVVTFSDDTDPDNAADDTEPHRSIIAASTIGDAATSSQLDTLLTLATGIVASARSVLSRTFRPNIAVPTLPSPFVIDLSPRLPASDVNADRFQVRYMHMGHDKPPADKVRVALLDVSIPEPWHNHNTHYIYDTDNADIAAIEDCIITALDTCAKQNNVRALLLPEYFIPRASLLKVRQRATERGILLIGGVEARPDSSGRSVNDALIQIPGRIDLYQRKQRPSVFELDKSNFAGNHQLHLVRNTVLGNIGVIVCSDYLEADLVSQLAVQANYRLHTLIVCARNPQPQVFETLARADAIRLYVHVIVVNSTDEKYQRTGPADTGGCLVAAPRRNLYPLADTPIELEPISEVGVPRLLMYDLESAEIHRRNKRRPDAAHWLPPSLFAQQG